MAIESNRPALTAQEPVIENEIPAYRAISPLAVISLLLGLLSVLCFVDTWFFAAAAGAVITGAMATRKIQRMPEVLTGRGLAQAGIALGLVFGLASITTETVQGYIRGREARKFANEYVEALKSGILSKAVWYFAPVHARKDITAEKALEDMQAASRTDPGMLISRTQPVLEVQRRFSSSPSATLTIDEIERHGLDGLEPYALVRLRLVGPGNADQNIAPHDDFALVVMKGTKEGNRYEWYVDNMTFPYKPKTYVLKERPLDDGHGHPGGH